MAKYFCNTTNTVRNLNGLIKNSKANALAGCQDVNNYQINCLMKYTFLLLLIIATNAFAQKQKVEYYLYDKDWKGIKDVASADYVVQLTNISDSLFVNRIFKGTGHLWKQESFRDADQTTPQGQFAWYDDEGRIDSSGYVNNKKKNGSWTYYDDTLGIYLSINYENGREVLRRDYVNKIIKSSYGEKTFDQEKREQDSSKQTNKIFVVDEKKASFKGGAAGYKKYLEKNLVPPTNILNTGPVKLQFIVDKSGKIENLLILKSLQLSADIEALRVLSETPDWTPAYQNGKNVI